MTDPASNLRALRQRVLDATAKGVTEGLEAARAAAIPLTPLGETGNLRSQTRITPIIMNQQGLSATLTYLMIYARYQHEGYGFNFREPGTGAGFLSRAGDQEAETAKAIIRNHIQGALR